MLDPTDPTLGTVDVGFELHRALGETVGTIVAVEGGPGYSSTGSRDYYLDLFEPLAYDHDLLLVDVRGTGMSDPINCAELQSYEGDYIANVGLCGEQLGAAADVYGTAFAADDLAAVLDHLGIATIDLYGDSYGTFFAQSFALRHGHRLRTLTMDAAYPVEDQDPWYRDLNRAMRDAIRSVCAEDAECSVIAGDPVDRLATLAAAVADESVSGTAYDGDGIRRKVTVDAPMVAYLAAVAAYGTTVYEELEAAGSAWLVYGDPAPLLRMAAEQTYWGDAGPVDEFSQGLYNAVICNDYPQLWDIFSPIDTRPAQFAAAVEQLRATEPDAFAPFEIEDWLATGWSEADSCLRWPVPSRWVPPEPTPAVYPDVPTLVLVGELDSLTSPEGARIVSDRFPNSTFVEVANSGHVTALADKLGCVAGLVVRFVETLSAGDTSCVHTYPSVRTTDQFPSRLQDVAVPDGDGTVFQRQVASAVVATVGDVFPRWFAMYGTEGRGLRGGSFSTVGLDQVRFRLDETRWVSDIAVSGQVWWNRPTGGIRATVVFAGAAGGRLVITWNDWTQDAQAHLTGRIDGESVDLELPAP